MHNVTQSPSYLPHALRIVRHRLDDSTRDFLQRELTSAIADLRLDSDRHQAILSAIGSQVLRSRLPGEILQALAFYSTSHRHALLLENLPCQRFPASPRSGFTDEAELACTNALHFGLLELLSVTPLAVDYENDGRLIRNVTPVAGASGTTSSWGADAEFFWHTDNLHLPFGSGGADAQLYIPRYLSFFTVRNWEKIPTEVVALDDVMKSLDHCALDQLRSCEYTVHAPDSVETATPFTDVAVIERHGSDHFARFDRAATTAGTLPAAEALELWIQTLRHARAQEIILRPGDFLIFDNYRVLHRRRAFQPNSPETSRWLRRCYASRRPTRCRAAGIRNRR